MTELQQKHNMPLPLQKDTETEKKIIKKFSPKPNQDKAIVLVLAPGFKYPSETEYREQ